jgi:hypothetical protein
MQLCAHSALLWVDTKQATLEGTYNVLSWLSMASPRPQLGRVCNTARIRIASHSTHTAACLHDHSADALCGIHGFSQCDSPLLHSQVLQL